MSRPRGKLISPFPKLRKKPSLIRRLDRGKILMLALWASTVILLLLISLGNTSEPQPSSRIWKPTLWRGN